MPPFSAATLRRVETPADWIARIAHQRDRQAFADLFRRFAPKLKSYFLRNGFDDGEAEDLTQEAMLRVWRCAEQFDPARCEPWGWIYAIARNLRIDRFRKAVRQARHDHTPPDAPPNPESEILRTDDARRLKGALDTLPNDQIAVVHLAYWVESPHSEIARRLSLPLGTVKSRLRRAAARLRESLGE